MTADPLVIRGDPTKEFFISILTRDIELDAAIVDLVDNCTDGARRLRADGDYQGLWVRIDVGDDRFRIADNCGGIPADIARDYAFRFGRDPKMPTTKHSVGQFGVGMKRAVFKIGRRFSVDSRSEGSSFTVKHDIQQWAKDANDWDFRFSHLSEEPVAEAKRGTVIEVTALNQDVREAFGRENWRKRLRLELRSRIQEFLSAGLSLTLNKVPIDFEAPTLLSEKGLEPAKLELDYDDGPERVNVSLLCGLGPSEDPAKAGWYVFCNGRLLLEADKTEDTGWGTTSGAHIPRFHGQYNHFRGYVFFDSDDASLLPWNTTKTGVDTGAPLYSAVRVEMGKLARPVIDFLNALKREKEDRMEDDDPGDLELAVAKSQRAALKSVPTREVFKFVRSKAKQPAAPKTTSIQYDETIDRVRSVKKALNVRYNKDVGLKTFEYFYRAEVED